MFADLLSRLTGAAPEPLPEADGRLALMALLVRVARADGAYDQGEQDQIDKIAEERFAVSSAAAKDLRIQAETLESEAPDTVRFTRAIKAAVPYEDRIGVIEALWSVVLADGARDHSEDTQLRLVSNLLGINDVDSALARQRVNKA